MIAYSCPKCRSFLTAHDEDAGKKLACPSCGQRLQIPPPPPPNKTVLGKLEEFDTPARTVLGNLEDFGSAPQAESTTATRPATMRALNLEPVDGERKDDEYDERRAQWPRCPYCRYRGRPFIRERVAVAGWIVMGMIAFICVFLALFLCVPILLTPLCLLGLLIKEHYRVCGECGMQLP
jgi:DNA-directed RNA polymerase subunit RPC12/RpoP